MNTLTEDELTLIRNKVVTTKLGVISNICKCIEIATNKGAYSAEQLSFVGGLYDSLAGAIKTEVNTIISKRTKETKTEEEETKNDEVVME